jgi:type II secretory pathway component PulF
MVAMLGGLALAVVIYLAFVFPKTVATWEEHGRSLSLLEQTFAKLSSLCTSTGFLLIPALLLVIIGSGAWALLANARSKQEAASQ